MAKELVVDKNGVDPDSEGYIETFQEVEETQDDLTPEEIEAMVAENTALKSKNGRLENESKDYKKRYNDKVSLEDKAKKQKLIDDGKTEELLEVERLENKQIQERLLTTKTRVIRTKLENEILKLAPNCHDVDDVISNLDKSKYSIDTENDTVTGVKEALADVQKRKPYFFSNKKMPESYNGGGNPQDDKKGKILTIEEYNALPTKKAMQEALSEGRVEGLS